MNSLIFNFARASSHFTNGWSNKYCIFFDKEIGRIRFLFSNDENLLYKFYKSQHSEAEIKLVNFNFKHFVLDCAGESQRFKVSIDAVSFSDIRKFSVIFGSSLIGKRIYRAKQINLNKNYEKNCYFVQTTADRYPDFFRINYFFNKDRFIEHLFNEHNENNRLIVESRGEEGPYYDIASRHSFFLTRLSDKEIKEIKNASGIEYLL